MNQQPTPNLCTSQKIGGVMRGSEILIIKNTIGNHPQHDYLIVAESEQHLLEITASLQYLCPSHPIVTLPGWDCLPYDRVSPRHDIQAQRMAALAHLACRTRPPTIVVTTVSGLLQKLRPLETIINRTLKCTANDAVTMDALQTQLTTLGFKRTATVYEVGEYAIRGGIIDVFPSQAINPLRIDFFGDDLESIKSFDPTTQRSLSDVEEFILTPSVEVELSDATIANFCITYRGNHRVSSNDALFNAVKQGVYHPGIEHWLAYFYPQLDTVIDYLINPVFFILPHTAEIAQQRQDHIADYYQARLDHLKIDKLSDHPYHPCPPDQLYLDWATLNQKINPYPVITLARYQDSDESNINIRSIGTRPVSPPHDLKEYFDGFLKQGLTVHVACARPSTVERLTSQLRAQNFHKFAVVDSWHAAMSSPKKLVKIHHFELPQSFQLDQTIVIVDSDIYPTQHRKTSKKSRRSDLILSESSTLEPQSYVVHDDHGIAQFISLKMMVVNHIPHDCLELHFEGGDKLFLPIENLDLITRYGGQDTEVKLDRLGAAAWQSRKAKVKKRLEDIAHKLLDIAAQRRLQKGVIFHNQSPELDKFTDQFPFVETEDQNNAINDVINDLASGMPMDRLICGDVGFGKTEVAMRASFIVASQGKQVAILTPTTLLCRQHFKNFKNRFKDFPINVEQLSRFVGPKEAKKIKGDLETGSLDIVIATHAILSNSIQFKNLGLVIVDEEQHFGVKQKERLKHLSHNVHLLTLTATPIPRTLQMSLNGVRDLSIIATPPVDRLAVRTFITPFDPVVIREAILRELVRGGQIYYVCPHIKDLEGIITKLNKIMPNLRIALAHGQMAPSALEDIMDQFTSHQYDVLLSTNIIESGIDLSNVNSLFIHKAELFGLSQLYQLRGRIGRGKVRAYAYLLIENQLLLTTQAQKRLDVMQSLDSLGAGFQLANYDMDIRGAGNLLGQEQSGHVREVGVELYQQMLSDTIEQLRTDQAKVAVHKWVPDISIQAAILIPQQYIMDLSLRIEFYRRLAAIETVLEKENIVDELMDRFGKLPPETENLIQVINLKILCRRAGVKKLECGNKGIIISFFDNQIPYVDKLVHYVLSQAGVLKLRADHKLVSIRRHVTTQDQFDHGAAILNKLIELSHD